MGDFYCNTSRVCFQIHQQAKLCKPEQCSRQMNEGEKSANELFEAHGDSAMIFDLHEKTFNKMPFFVVVEIGVSSCHLCAPLDYLCRNHIIHDTSDFCKMLFGFFQTIMFRNTL